ncbi:MAG: hypothetical protein E3J87_11050 [Candidatus Cloacimonadota bacterium]|nr:MAG: hypothetical protein E3J87_11050 [Candidatus Cloacimonadota bacterium]
MEEYEVLGDFIILFPLEKGGRIYEEINLLNDVIRIALEKDHIKVKRINVRIVKSQKKGGDKK